MISILTSLVQNYYVKKMEYYRFNFHKTNPISIKVELYKNGGQNLVNLCKKKKKKMPKLIITWWLLGTLYICEINEVNRYTLPLIFNSSNYKEKWSIQYGQYVYGVYITLRHVFLSGPHIFHKNYDLISWFIFSTIHGI